MKTIRIDGVTYQTFPAGTTGVHFQAGDKWLNKDGVSVGLDSGLIGGTYDIPQRRNLSSHKFNHIK
jgi:hypothetical protein